MGKGKYRYDGNELVLLNSDQLTEQTAILDRHRSKLPDVCGVIQRFLKSKGNRSFIWRTVWNAKKAPIQKAFVITNKYSYLGYSESIHEDNHTIGENERLKTFFCASIGNDTSTTAIRGRSGRQPAIICRRVASYLEKRLGRSLEQLTLDLLKDDEGSGGCSRLSLTEMPNEQQKTAPFYQIQVCKQSVSAQMCNVLPAIYRPSRSRLLYELSSNMILFLLAHLKENLTPRKFKKFEGDKFRRELSSGSSHKVCATCYELYRVTERLWRAEEMLNYSLCADDCSLSLRTVLIDSMVAKLHRGIPPRTHSNHDIVCRILIAVHCVRNLPRDMLRERLKENAGSTSQAFILHLGLLGEDIDVRLISASSETDRLVVAKRAMIRTFFFRIGEHELKENHFRLEKFIRSGITSALGDLCVELYHESAVYLGELNPFYDESIGLTRTASKRMVGTGKMSLEQFKSTKISTLTKYVPLAYMHNDDMTDTKISVGLQICGRTYGGCVSAKEVYKCIHVPKENFHVSDPLPKDWIALLRRPVEPPALENYASPATNMDATPAMIPPSPVRELVSYWSISISLKSLHNIHALFAPSVDTPRLWTAAYSLFGKIFFTPQLVYNPHSHSSVAYNVTFRHRVRATHSTIFTAISSVQKELTLQLSPSLTESEDNALRTLEQVFVSVDEHDYKCVMRRRLSVTLEKDDVQFQQSLRNDLLYVLRDDHGENDQKSAITIEEFYCLTIAIMRLRKAVNSVTQRKHGAIQSLPGVCDVPTEGYQLRISSPSEDTRSELQLQHLKLVVEKYKSEIFPQIVVEGEGIEVDAYGKPNSKYPNFLRLLSTSAARSISWQTVLSILKEAWHSTEKIRATLERSSTASRREWRQELTLDFSVETFKWIDGSEGFFVSIPLEPLKDQNCISDSFAIVDSKFPSRVHGTDFPAYAHVSVHCNRFGGGTTLNLA